MFRDAKAGDRVWSLQWGWGMVRKIGSSRENYPIDVLFDQRGNNEAFTTAGFWRADNLFPSLFWDEIQIVAPPKPKRKVKKVIEGWGNVYPAGDGVVVSLHASQQKADREADTARRLGLAMNFRHEYEVEE